MLRAGRRALPDLPEHHRRRRARDARRGRRARPARASTRSPTGTPVFDWTVPREWNIARRLGRRTRTGERVVDFARLQPARRQLQRAGAGAACRSRSCRPHLHTLPEQPDWIPYRTSYYAETWGFCLDASAQLGRWPTASTRSASTRRSADGHLTYGECVLPGRDRRGGADLLPRLPPVARQRQPLRHRGGRRAWPSGCGRLDAPLHLPLPVRPGHDRRDHLAGPQPATRPRASATAWSLACVGDARRVHLQAQPARRRRRSTAPSRTCSRTPGGRTRSSTSRPTATTSASTARPGFDLPVGCLTRTPHGRYPEYHTSADDLELRRAAPPRRVARDAASRSLDVLEGDRRYRNTQPASASRSSAGAASTGSTAATRTPARPSWRCCGC